MSPPRALWQALSLPHPCPFRLKRGQKANVSAGHQLLPAVAASQHFLSIFVKRNGFRKRKKLAPEDGLTPIKCCKDSNMGEETNGVHFRLQTPNQEPYTLSISSVHTVLQVRMVLLLDHSVYPIGWHFVSSVYRLFPAVCLLFTTGSRWTPF